MNILKMRQNPYTLPHLCVILIGVNRFSEFGFMAIRFIKISVHAALLLHIKEIPLWQIIRNFVKSPVSAV